MRVSVVLVAFTALMASWSSSFADASTAIRSADAQVRRVVSVDCKVSGWTYEPCDKYGLQRRTRCVTTAPRGRGKVCPVLAETVWCSLHNDCSESRKIVAGSVDGIRHVSAVLDILAYNDVYELQQDTVNGLGVGGPSRVVLIAKAMKQKNPNALVLFAGDTMSPSLWSLQYKGLQMVDAHNAIGVDFASLGNHEFDFGVDAFLAVSEKTKFPWLNANCFELATGNLLRGTRPNAIKILQDPLYGKITVGRFGVMYDMHDATKGLYWTDPIEEAKKQVKILQDRKVDMIIALTHQPLEDDNRLSAQVPGIHVIYGGHDHSSVLQTDFGTPYLKAAYNFRSIWQSHVEYFANDTATAATFRMTHTARLIANDLPTDAGLDAKIDEFKKEISVLFERVVGSICPPGLDLTTNVVRAKDAPIGRIFADAHVQYYGEGIADVALVNGGAIRTEKAYPASSFTLATMIAWSPFGNVIMVVETDGHSLKQFIAKEMLGSCGPTGQVNNGLYTHPAGIKWEFTCTESKKGSLTSIEWYGHATRTGPVLDDDVLWLACNEYVFKTEFMTIPGVRSKLVKSEAEAVRIEAVLEAYIQKQPDLTLCENGPSRSMVKYATAG